MTALSEVRTPIIDHDAEAALVGSLVLSTGSVAPAIEGVVNATMLTDNRLRVI
ncbi:MAG: hypothetical protein GY842_19035 [bacterium]|nr:hypothetical protein [bacterium]